MLVLSALVTGSLAPDFHYFLDLGPHGHFSHSIIGAFVYSLPVSLMLLWVFQQIMKLPLISLSPEPVQQRLIGLAASFRWGPWRRFLLILFALLVGIFSHLAWDAFTHDRGFVVRNIPDLRSRALEDFGTHRPLYNVLQHASSLLGMGFLAFWGWRWFKRTSPQPVPAYLRFHEGAKIWFIVSFLILASAIALPCAWINSDHLDSRSIFAGTLAVTFMSVVWIEIFAFSVWWQWRRRNRVIGSSGDRVIGTSISDEPMS